MFEQANTLPVVIAIVAGVTLVMVILAGVLYEAAFGSRSRLNRRVQGMFGPGGQRRIRETGLQQKKKPLAIKLKQQNNAKKRAFSETMQERLMQAGLSLTVRNYFMFSILFAVVSEGVYFVMGFNRLGLIFIPPITGLGIPMLIVSTMRKRRIAKFLLLFPDALDIITRGIKSGLPVGECVSLIGREMPEPVSTEFRIISESQKLAVPLDEALMKSTERVPLAELRFLSIVLTIQQQTGGNLADTLAKLSEVIRLRKKMRDKVSALSAEAKASAMIIGSLPIIVAGLLSLTAPDYIAELINKETGHLILLMGASTMSVGIFVMRQMINFDI